MPRRRSVMVGIRTVGLVSSFVAVGPIGLRPGGQNSSPNVNFFAQRS
jgi:hypothetical protein